MRTLLLSLTAAAVLVAPATAGAVSFCVNSASCVAGGGTNEGTGAKALQNSLDQAAKLAGPDHVVVGAGTYVRSGRFSYDVGGVAGNPVVVEGAGSAQTVLQNSAAGSGTTLFVKGAGSTVKALRTVLADGSPSAGLYLGGANTVAHDVAVRGQANTTHGTGVYLDGATLEKGDIVSTGTQLGYGVEGDGKVVDSSVTASDYSYGIYGPRTVQRTTIQGAGTERARGSWQPGAHCPINSTSCGSRSRPAAGASPPRRSGPPTLWSTPITSRSPAAPTAARSACWPRPTPALRRTTPRSSCAARSCGASGIRSASPRPTGRPTSRSTTPTSTWPRSWSASRKAARAP